MKKTLHARSENWQLIELVNGKFSITCNGTTNWSLWYNDGQVAKQVFIDSVPMSETIQWFTDIQHTQHVGTFRRANITLMVKGKYMINILEEHNNTSELVKVDGALLQRTSFTSVSNLSLRGFKFFMIETIQCRENVNLYVSFKIDTTVQYGELSLLDTMIAKERSDLVQEIREMINKRLQADYSRNAMALHIADSNAIEGITTL